MSGLLLIAAILISSVLLQVCNKHSLTNTEEEIKCIFDDN